jgi:hypothetical protein
MDELKTKPLPRADIGAFIGSPRGVRAFENLQGDATSIYDAVSNAPFLTLSMQNSLGSERVFTPSSAFAVNDGGASGDYTIDLADTGVVAGGFGAATKTIKVTVDAKGRVSAIETYDLNTDNVTEGTTNLFFTNARARGALSSGAGIAYDSSTGAIALDPASPRNVDHAAVAITAGTGLTGGGDLTASRTLALATVGAPGTYASPTSITVDAYGRITAIS